MLAKWLSSIEVVLRIEVVDRLRAFAGVEHECIIAGAADRDSGGAGLREP